VICAPVYVKSNGHIDKAKADAVGTTEVLGLVSDVSIPTTESGNVRFGGVLTATTTQWDAVAGTTGGLSAGSIYFLSETTAGEITATPPDGSGEYLERLGKALSTTELQLNIMPPIRL
jgi:hypothetical protein